MTSRDSHDVRHIDAVRQARSGRPRWKNEASRPAQPNTTATAAPTAKSPPSGTGPSPCQRSIHSAVTSASTSPCAAPARVVKKTTERAGCIAAWRGYQDVTSSSDGSSSEGLGSRPSFFSGLSARCSWSGCALIGVRRRGR